MTEKAASTAKRDDVESTPVQRDRLHVAGDWLASAARVSLQIICVAVLLWGLAKVLGKIQSILMPIALALLIATVLWPAVGWLRRRGFPDSLAAALMTITGVAAVVGIVAGIVPSVMQQSKGLGQKAIDGGKKALEWLHGPPFNVEQKELDNFIQTITKKLEGSAGQIAQTAMSGVSTLTSSLLSVFTILFLVFFFLKDGPKFLPWLRSTSGTRAGDHLAELLARIWNTLSGFIRTQAIVSFIDAFFIGAALFFLGVPLWFPLTVITFVAGFIPIVGAVVAGILAVLIALVGKSWIAALIMLGVILLVQQIEGNVLQPMLQAKVMELHAAIVLLAVMLGSDLAGIPGAFLAVPVAATVAVIFRYANEQLARKAAEESPPDEDADRKPKSKGRAAAQAKAAAAKVKAKTAGAARAKA
ncbi:MAG: AI-2E family transporter [Gordonia sp. (in: high G+C Gram-positive bacteria)]|uniref:AI-2E family transporter n=1 Tax=Gordonia sp. (in: high G+C Gram-positive bacteria) TaxID=84139 RepID=UPI0039E47792